MEDLNSNIYVYVERVYGYDVHTHITHGYDVHTHITHGYDVHTHITHEYTWSCMTMYYIDNAMLKCSHNKYKT